MTHQGSQTLSASDTLWTKTPKTISARPLAGSRLLIGRMSAFAAASVGRRACPGVN